MKKNTDILELGIQSHCFFLNYNLYNRQDLNFFICLYSFKYSNDYLSIDDKKKLMSTS